LTELAKISFSCIAGALAVAPLLSKYSYSIARILAYLRFIDSLISAPSAFATLTIFLFCYLFFFLLLEREEFEYARFFVDDF
jgi:hypothetical protein